jgi:Ca2+:H+ antiporter
VFSLIMPDLTKTEPDPSVSPFQATLLGAITSLFYAIFLAIQTMRHRSFFAEPVNGKAKAVEYMLARRARPIGPVWDHVLMLLLTLAPIVVLSTYLAVIVDFGIEHLGAPAPLGGILVAILVLSPRGADRLSRGARQPIAAGSECVPRLGARDHRPDHPGGVRHRAMDRLRGASWTRSCRRRPARAHAVSALTFGGARTNVLQGTVHLLLSVVYIALIFSP